MQLREKWFPAHGETNVVARFEKNYDRPDIAKSLEADEFIPMELIVCRMKVVGDPDESVVPMKPHNKQHLIDRFPDAWRDFNGEAMEVSGTPLTELGLTEAKILDFRLNGVSTVEQVAALSDANCEAIGFGTRKLRSAAQAMIAAQQQEASERVLAAAAAPVPPRKRGRPSNAERAARQAAH